MNRIEESRREFERRLEEVRGSLESEVGFSPRKVGWLLPLAALSLGVALALRSRRSKD